MTRVWRVRGRDVALARPFVVGILNVTPDSFSDGGRYSAVDAAVARAEAMAAEGADAVDVGGESTRPQGATPVDAAEERRRVLPVVAELARRMPSLVVSVDTVKATVAAAALDAGAHVVNDVSAFRLDANMAAVCARAGAGVVLMHSRGTVSEMGTYLHAAYGDDPAADVIAELGTAVDRARDAGVADAAIVLDPGLGFAKRSADSLRLLSELPRLGAAGYPLMVGASRKRFVGELTGVQSPADRVHGTVGASVAALLRGAMLVRVHDVRAHREALDVAWAIAGAGAAEPVGARQ
ncbi:MAG: Dihydropteroate synthase [uncultured Gemmatimonadaceae bacterium]|uniref:Dihydropteroate synthase n=1 Tax=uncultured Gemmatimonadaceae bacterium TaxID=246130 RepID=A0A6J4L0P2_9BACT|nr:MAG: Dihydropteroate synthase [uncultured Gemmatimonadaceae bacterium]